MSEYVPIMTPVSQITPVKVKIAIFLLLWQALHLIVKITIFTSKEKSLILLGWGITRSSGAVSDQAWLSVAAGKRWLSSPELKPLHEDMSWLHLLSHAGQYYFRFPNHLPNSAQKPCLWHKEGLWFSCMFQKLLMSLEVLRPVQPGLHIHIFS